MARATTVRFTDEIFARLDQASARTGMPVNSIVIAACLEWMHRHAPPPTSPGSEQALPIRALNLAMLASAPRWATLRRAVEQAVGGRGSSLLYPFERFTATAQNLFVIAQGQAKHAGYSYIGTEHLLLAALAAPTSHAGQVLAAAGVNEAAVRPVLEKLLKTEKRPRARQIVPTSRVKAVIELAFKLCSAAGEPRVTTGHILLGLSKEGRSVAAQALDELKVSNERIAALLEALTEPEA